MIALAPPDPASVDETQILEILNRTGALLASKLELQRLVQAVTDAATKVSGAEFGAFFYTITNDVGDVFTLYTLSGAPREAFAKLGHPRSTPVFGPTFRGEGVIRLDDVKTDPRYGQWAPHHGMPAGHLPVCSYLAVPVVTAAGEVIGGLFFGHSKPSVFTDRSERLVKGIAGQAAIAIDNARLYERTKRDAEERSRLLESERAARVEVERISLLKDEFLATLSHELRTPLNAIVGWSDILLGQEPPDSPRRRALVTIARNARAQALLIDDLLDMSRIISGKIRLDVQKVDLPAIVEQALDALRAPIDAKQIRLRPTLDPAAGPVFGDPGRLQQVVWNLLSNAVKFTAKGGRVDVVLRRINSHVELIIQDSGIGIAAEMMQQIFERFRQVDGSPNRQHGGLGLGLAIVKELVTLHGGSVHATSEGLGKGATFAVHLPVRAIREAPPSHVHPTRSDTPTTLHRISLEGIRVVAVDDDPDARELVGFLLDSARAEVATASGAEDALDLIKTGRYHVLVSDIGMPDIDGYELIRMVRELPAERGGSIPAIALTAFARADDRTRARLAGYQAHLSKPVDTGELLATIASFATMSDRAR